jgi:preprotein translocase subunit SecG
MGGLELAIGIVLLAFAVLLVIIVMFQQGEQKNSGVVTGGFSDTYISKHSGRTIDAFLGRWTKIFAVFFFASVIALNIIMFVIGGGHGVTNVEAGAADDTTAVVSTVEDTASTATGAADANAATSAAA